MQLFFSIQILEDRPNLSYMQLCSEKYTLYSQVLLTALVQWNFRRGWGGGGGGGGGACFLSLQVPLLMSSHAGTFLFNVS